MTDLIARDDYLSQLHTLLDKALQGQLQIALVTGEAGIGKTALVAAFLDEAKSRCTNLSIASSKCYAIAGSQQEAYLPFWQILEALIGLKRGDVAWDRARRGMTEVAPDWLAAIPGVGGVIAATLRTYQWGRREFGEQGQGADTSRRMVQYTNALQVAAETAPLLLWIDDLHWADNATLDLISFLADQASDSRIMLVGAYRPTDIASEEEGHSHPVKRLVSKLERYHQCEELALSSFSNADLVSLLTTRGYRFHGPFIDHLWRQSGGNPLFIQEYLALLQARGLLKQDQGCFVLKQPNIAINIPHTALAVIEQRLDLIGRDLRRLLGYASVQGERFASRVLAQLLTAPELDVLERLNLLDRVHHLVRELEAQHLVVKVGAEYQFIHVLIQQVIYNGLSAGQRRQLHASIAQLLENLYGEDSARYAADLAVHFERGGLYTQAVHYYLQAGHNALEAFALDDAVVQAEAARRIARTESGDESSAQWHIEALILTAAANCLKAEHTTSLAACDEGESLCKRTGSVEQYAIILYWRSKAYFGMGRRNDYRTAIRQALEVLGTVPANPSLQGHLYTLIGEQYGTESLTDMEQALEMALTIGEEHHLPRVQANALQAKGFLSMALRDRPDEALSCGLEALAIAENQNTLMDQCICHRLVAYALRHLKRGEQAFFHNSRAVAIARQIGAPYTLHEALASLAVWWRQVRGNLTESLQTAKQAIYVAKQYGFVSDYWVIGEWFYPAYGLGDWREAERALTEYDSVYHSFYPVWSYRQRAFLAHAHGQYSEAIENYHRAYVPFDGWTPNERDLRRFQPWLGLALLEVGDLEQGVEQLESARSYWQGRDPAGVAHSLRGLAKVDLIRGNVQSAVAHLREALTAVEGYYNEDAWPAWPHVCSDLARALLVAVSPEEASQHALVGYNEFKKMQHFLLGESAFVLGQVLFALARRDEALACLHEARDEWERLGLTHYLPAWHAFMQERGLLE